MAERAASHALGGRARGVLIGALIAFGWALFGTGALAGATRYALLAVAAAITATLLLSAMTMLRRARALPKATATAVQAQGSRRAWRLFWLNFAGEVILLNIATALLSAPRLRVFWVPAISLVVGLHFLPMAGFFRVRSYRWVGAAMMVTAAVVAMEILRDRTLASALIHGEAIANAAILWSALAFGVVASRS